MDAEKLVMDLTGIDLKIEFWKKFIPKIKEAVRRGESLT